MRRFFAIVAGCFTTAFGCAVPQLDGTVPRGEWTGEGWYVAEKWSFPISAPATTGPSEPTTGHAQYPTTLSIRPLRITGHETIELAIRSEHHDDMMKEDLRLRVALEYLRRVSESTILYRVVDWHVSDDKPLSYKSTETGGAATCTTKGGETILIINYQPNFADIYHFRGMRLEKTGTYYDRSGDNTTLVHWMERLDRR